MSNVSLTELFKRSFRESAKSLSTCIPGYVLTFDSATQLAQVQIGVRRVDVNGEQFVPPPIIQVPVFVYGGSGFIVECQIDPGDEGLILFSQRCIDGWLQTGGVGNNPILRFHDTTDALFIPGFRSRPKAISGHANNGVRMRNAAGDSYIWLKNDGTAEINVSTLVVTGDIQHTGDQTTTGTITGQTDVVFGPNATSGIAHTHPQGPDSGGNTEQDTGAPNP